MCDARAFLRHVGSARVVALTAFGGWYESPVRDRYSYALMCVSFGRWAHQVECVDDSISLTHNFLPKENFSAVRACLLANRLGKTVQEAQEPVREPSSEC